MIAIFQIIGGIFSVIFIILILVFVVPFEYSIEAENKEEFSARANVCWMFRFFKIKIFREAGENKLSLIIISKPVVVKKLYKREDKDEQENKNTKRFKLKEYLNKRFFTDVFEYIKDIINIIKPSIVKIHGVYGFEDPSITGALSGVIPLISNLIPNRDIRLKPEFYDEILEVEAKIAGKVILFTVLCKTLKLIFKKSIREKIFKKRKKVETY